MQSTTSAEPALTASSDAGSEQSTASLVTALAGDVKHLGESYLQLTRIELARSLRKGVQLAAASTLAVLGVSWLSVGAVLLLVDDAELSRAAACAWVGGVLAALGAVWVVASARRRTEQT